MCISSSIPDPPRREVPPLPPPAQPTALKLRKKKRHPRKKSGTQKLTIRKGGSKPAIGGLEVR